FASLPQGQVTLALTRNGSRTDHDLSLALLVMIDVRDKRDQLSTTLADLRHKWMDSGKSIKTERIRNIEFSVLSVSDQQIPAAVRNLFLQSPAGDLVEEDEAHTAARDELVIGQFESLLIVGTSLKAVEKVAVHLTGGGMPSLGDLAAYEANRLALFR